MTTKETLFGKKLVKIKFSENKLVNNWIYRKCIIKIVLLLTQKSNLKVIIEVIDKCLGSQLSLKAY